MESVVSWNTNYNFTSKIRNHQFELDASLSNGSFNRGPNPKEILLSSISACAGMDLVYLVKDKGLLNLDINAKAEMTKTKPSIFANVVVTFKLFGTLNNQDASEACKISMTKLCGVSAMLTKACPIYYEVYLNNEFITKGESKFNI